MITVDTFPDHSREHWLISNSRAYRYRRGRPAEPSALAPIDGAHCVVVAFISSASNILVRWFESRVAAAHTLQLVCKANGDSLDHW